MIRSYVHKRQDSCLAWWSQLLTRKVCFDCQPLLSYKKKNLYLSHKIILSIMHWNLLSSSEWAATIQHTGTNFSSKVVPDQRIKNIHVLMVGEIGAPRENPCKHGENMHTPHWMSLMVPATGQVMWGDKNLENWLAPTETTSGSGAFSSGSPNFLTSTDLSSFSRQPNSLMSDGGKGHIFQFNAMLLPMTKSRAKRVSMLYAFFITSNVLTLFSTVLLKPSDVKM